MLGRVGQYIKGRKQDFADGLVDFLNTYANTRNVENTNSFRTDRIDEYELREIFKHGLASKIYRIKTGYALNETLTFDTVEDEEFYTTRLAAVVKRAAQFQLGFGRGIVMIHNRGGDLSEPLPEVIPEKALILRAFSGDMINVGEVSFNLENDRDYKPLFYSVRGHRTHHSRIMDFSYYEPVEDDLSIYDYGGISEAELIYTQMINDGVVERATGAIVERNSTLFYKVKGFKQRLETKQHAPMLEYFRRLENSRSIYGAGLLDAEDEVISVAQNLTNLSEANDTTLRRLAMVTGIPLPMLIGENVKGLNSSGDTERQTFNDTITNYAQDYLLPVINSGMQRLGRGPVGWGGLQLNSPLERASFDEKILNNALRLAELGQDPQRYLEKHGVAEPDMFDDFFASGESGEKIGTE